MKLSKKLQKLFAMLLVAVMVVSVLPVGSLSVFAATGEFAGGNGTEGNPYLIATKTQLNNVRNYLDAHFKLIADIEFDDSDFQYGGEFYNDGAGFVPIGAYNYPFSGTFDGENHVIKNLYINIESGSTVYAGLFGYNKGTIKNLGMVDGSVSANTETDHYRAAVYAGGIVGYNYYRTITNCYNTGSVSADIYSYDSYAHAYAGGIVGNNENGTIENCNNTGNVSATSSSSSSNAHAYAYAGGVVGLTNYGTIVNGYNTGNVSANAFYAYAGGIVGNNVFGKVTNCYNTGDVSASSSKTSAFAGGIAGLSYLTITNCYNTGNVSADASYSYSYAGGIVGYNYERATITNCYNTGDVSTYTSSSDYNAFAGGIVGFNYGGTITNCYNIASFSKTSNDGTTYVGGIAGYSAKLISNCYYIDNNSEGVGKGTDTATKCTNEELKNQDTFVGFDFETVWTMDNEVGYPYPVLKDVEMVEVLVYNIDGDYIFSVRAGTKVSTLIDGITEGEYCKVYNGENELGNNELVGTGMVVKIIDGDSVKATYTLVIKGDINGDGKIDSVDYLLIKRSAFGTYTLTEAMTLAGDINEDVLINSVDYLLVKRACFGTYKI